MHVPMSDAGAHELPVVVNAGAGRGGDVAERLRDVLADAGIPARVASASPTSIGDQLQSLVADGAAIIGVAGGDGTMRTAAQLLVNGPATLAPFPAGTLNHFTQRIGLRTAADTAAALKAGRMHAIAVGRMEDRVFLNTATFGLYADVLRRRERLRGWLGKWPAAAVSFLITLVRLRPVHLRLEAADRSIDCDTALLWVGIGWGSFPAVHQAAERRATPVFEVAVLRDLGRLRLFAFGMRTFWRVLRRGAPVNDPALELMHVRTLAIESRRGHVGITLDGEVMPRRHSASVWIEDEALRVVVGKDSAAPAALPQAPSVNRRATVR